MSRLTGAGEQRGAEVIDEQGDTVPLPVVPSSGDRPQSPGDRSERSGDRSFAERSKLSGLPPSFAPIAKKVALGLAVCLVAGAGYAGLQQIANAPADPNAPGTHSPLTSATPDEAAEGVRRAVAGEAVLQKMADAVENDKRTEFLDTIDPKAARNACTSTWKPTTSRPKSTALSSSEPPATITSKPAASTPGSCATHGATSPACCKPRSPIYSTSARRGPVPD